MPSWDVIKTARQHGVHAKKRDRILSGWHRMGFRLSMAEFYTAVRGREDFPVQTANLQHSVGVQGPVPASNVTLGSLPASSPSGSDLKGAGGRNVRKRAGGGFSLFLFIGMVYARHALQDGEHPAVQEPLQDLAKIIKRNFDLSTKRAVDQLAGRGGGPRG